MRQLLGGLAVSTSMNIKQHSFYIGTITCFSYIMVILPKTSCKRVKQITVGRLSAQLHISSFADGCVGGVIWLSIHVLRRIIGVIGSML